VRRLQAITADNFPAGLDYYASLLAAIDVTGSSTGTLRGTFYQ